MSLSRAEIAQLIPHTGAMCLLESVQQWDGDRIVCTAVSHRDPANPLRRDGVLPAVCGVEYAAQAMGVHGRLAANNRSKPAVGYLASLRDLVLQAERLDDGGDRLTVEVRRLADSGESVMCEFTIRGAERELLRGRATLLMEAA
jgi:predicted hotdog family 3-hydroxylacyl-ACP dehydratase